jgi:hypothetical protein
MRKRSTSLHTVLKNHLQNGVTATQFDFIHTILWRQNKRIFALQVQKTWTGPFSGTSIFRNICRHDFEQNELPSNFFSEVSFNDRTNFFFTKKKSFSKN